MGIFDLWAGFFCLVTSSMVTYYIAASIKSPMMPWIAFVGLMGHMLYLHAYRELFPRPGVVDITGAQMVLVMKVGNLRIFLARDSLLVVGDTSKAEC